jgi:hypothetical protein
MIILFVTVEDAESKPVRVFLSHSTNDLTLVMEIKEGLTRYGLEVFVAHVDIEPSSEWQDEIIRQLELCNVFIPIISDNYRNSRWTDQESGIAIAYKKFIIPIEVNLTPYGFIGKWQALRYRDDVSDTCTKIIETIKTKSPFKKELTDCLINYFVSSIQFNEANDRAELLSEYKPFTADQIDKIVNGFLNNSQISGAWTARHVFRDMYPEYSELVKPEHKDDFERIIRYKI